MRTVFLLRSWHGSYNASALQGIRTRFAGADADHLFKVMDEYLAVTDFAGVGSFLDRLQHRSSMSLLIAASTFILGRKSPHIQHRDTTQCAPFAPETFDFGDGDACTPMTERASRTRRA